MCFGGGKSRPVVDVAKQAEEAKKRAEEERAQKARGQDNSVTPAERLRRRSLLGEEVDSTGKPIMRSGV